MPAPCSQQIELLIMYSGFSDQRSTGSIAGSTDLSPFYRDLPIYRDSTGAALKIYVEFFFSVEI